MLDKTLQENTIHPFYREKVERRYRRRTATGLTCDITDGSVAFNGTVEDISLGGFKLINVPVSFDGKKHKYTILISDRENHYKIIARPCWTKRQEILSRQDVGFKILDAPLEWVAYILK